MARSKSALGSSKSGIHPSSTNGELQSSLPQVNISPLHPPLPVLQRHCRAIANRSAMAASPALRQEVIRLYKGPQQPSLPPVATMTTDRFTELLYLGREYPLGYDYFRPRLKKAFSAKANLSNEDEIKKGIEQGEYVKKGSSSFILDTVLVHVLFILTDHLQRSKHCKYKSHNAVANRKR